VACAFGVTSPTRKRALHVYVDTCCASREDICTLPRCTIVSPFCAFCCLLHASTLAGSLCLQFLEAIPESATGLSLALLRILFCYEQCYRIALTSNNLDPPTHGLQLQCLMPGWTSLSKVLLRQTRFFRLSPPQAL
jgi:hypothetical protein